MIQRRFSPFLFALLLAAAGTAQADEGMWTYNNFPKQLVQQRYGFTPTDAWLDHIRLSSIRFNNGGSGSFVSSEGLVMTNHHVGSECIQQLSSAGKDYLAAGFSAAAREQEAKCPSLELNVLMGIEDVTSAVNADLTAQMDSAARLTSQRGAMAKLEKDCTEKTGLRCDVVTLYEGGVFNLYRYKKYTDVRLAFSPEFDIAFYGGDPDNFTYPRYDFDVAFFRVYENNQPAKIEHYLVWNPGGIKEGDLVFVSGNPGATRRQNTLAQLEFSRDVQFPVVVRWLETRIKLLREFAARGAEQERIAKDTLFSYENGLKVYVNQLKALRDPEFMTRRAAVEKQLRDAVAANPAWQREFGGAWDAIAAAEKDFAAFYAERRVLSTGLLQSKLFEFALDLVRLSVELPKPNDQRLREYRDSNLESLKQDLFSEAPVYPALDAVQLTQAFQEMVEILGPNDPFVQKVLGGRTAAQAADSYVSGSKLAASAERRKLFDGGKAAVDSSTDTMIQLARLVDPRARELRNRYERQVQAVERANGSLLAKALFATHGTNLYPEATFTLRLSYGAVKGYTDEGRPRRWYTTFYGLYELNAGVNPYKLPQRWLDKRAALKLDTPYNFVSMPDITGGNSGSPMVNRDGELVGIVFDGNLQQIPSDFLYTDAQARTIALHAAAIIEALRSVYAADALLRELKVVRQK